MGTPKRKGSRKLGSRSLKRAYLKPNYSTIVAVHDFAESLKSGVVLCKLMDVIKPNSIMKINYKIGVGIVERVISILSNQTHSG
jgi:hypothetical protein